MENSVGLLGNAATVTSVALVMGTTPWLALHFSPLRMFAHAPPRLARGGGGTKDGKIPLASLVHSVSSIVPVCPRQHNGSPSSSLFIFSIPVYYFSLLVAVFQFQEELLN